MTDSGSTVGQNALPTAPPFLEVLAGNDLGATFRLDIGETRVGRSAENDVVLADLAISRKHFLVVRDKQRCLLRDTGSGNGTLVNGRQVREVELAEGDEIEIGETLLRFAFPTSNAATLPPEFSAAALSRRNAVGPQITQSLPAVRRKRTGHLAAIVGIVVFAIGLLILLAVRG